MLSPDFFKKSPEVTERIFVAVTAISGLAAASFRTANYLIAIEFTLMAVCSAVLSVASYVRRSRNQRVDGESTVP
jgi:hypothetical protein